MYYSIKTNRIETKRPIGQVIEIKIYYSLGGMNYFSSNIERRGLYLHITPVYLTPFGSERALTGHTNNTGYKIFLKELKRRSNKIQAKYELELNRIADRIGILFVNEKHNEIYNLVQQIFN